jgi:hypothetical protein
MHKYVTPFYFYIVPLTSLHSSFLRAAYSANLTCTSRTRRNMSNLALDAGMLLVVVGKFSSELWSEPELN